MRNLMMLICVAGLFSSLANEFGWLDWWRRWRK